MNIFHFWDRGKRKADCLSSNTHKTKKMKSLFTASLFFLFSIAASAQVLTQSIKGTVTDEDSKMPIIGATVVVVDSDPFLGASTDIDGSFKIENVPVGRVTLQVTFIGYEPRTIANVDVTSGKEVYFDVTILEDVKVLETFEVNGYADKTESINEMSLMSSKMFTVEETKRYAGSLNDPARMVSSYAGVSSNAEGNNDIIVRGNSPKGILWRLEGVEIPNPNHFADEGATGGPINALNSSMLANSDFSTGAFAPEYGNAMSGVFDMKLRKGNSDDREYSIGVGVIGTEATIEGPFKKGGKSSYLANYRYSTLGILDNAGVVDFGGVPKYQDGSFNLYFPTKKLGTFTVFGLGGISKISDKDFDVESEGDTTYYEDTYNAHVAVGGITNTFLLNDKSYIRSVASISSNGSGYVNHEGLTADNLTLVDEAQLRKTTYRFSSAYNVKLSARTKLQAGAIYTNLGYDFFFEYLDEETSIIERPLNESGTAGMGQAYTSIKHRFGENMTVVGGLHYLHYFYNNTNSIEPRLAMEWRPAPIHTVTLGYGKHSKTESLLNYTAKAQSATGVTITPNRSLDLPKAHHFVAGYGIQVSKNVHIKAEAYYQHLYDVPVEDSANSSNSLINSSEWFTSVGLANDGVGRNYGLEFTLERFFANKYYYLVTASLYQSEYKANDNEWHSTRYNGNYNLNFLCGKEFKVGKNKAITTNIKTAFLGANRYTPIDLAASRAAGETRRDESRPFEAKGDDVFFVNVSGGYKVNRPKATHEIKFEVLNATNNKAAISKYYNATNDQIETGSEQLPLIPNIIYTVNF